MNPVLNVSRRSLLVAGAAAAVAGTAASAAEPREIVVHKSPVCGCCKYWIAHLEKAGFKATVNETREMTAVKAKLGVPEDLASCHTGVIAGYFIEGHVPAADILRLVRDKPMGLGLAVPGMPVGSPGMEGPAGTKVEPFQTLLLLDKTGRTRVFASHNAA